MPPDDVYGVCLVGIGRIARSCRSVTRCRFSDQKSSAQRGLRWRVTPISEQSTLTMSHQGVTMEQQHLHPPEADEPNLMDLLSALWRQRTAIV